MKKSTIFFAGITGFLFSLTFSSNPVFAKDRFTVSQIVKAVTVKILPNGEEDDTGSGVIVNKQGDTYTIVTNAHVLCGQEVLKTKACNTAPKYTIITFDKHHHKVSSATVMRVDPALDIAVIKFRSLLPYQAAQLAKNSPIKNQDLVYTAGFPANSSELKFDSGQVVAHTKDRISSKDGGYTMLYDAETLPGMSGSGVFDQEGKVVAIHGQGDKFKDGTETTPGSDIRIQEKIGVNRGIPISRLQVNNGQVTAVSNKVTAPTTADAFLTLSFNKFISPNLEKIESEKLAALALVNNAIEKQPNYLYAYLLRGWIYTQLQDNKKALADFDRAAALDDKVYAVYLLRSSTRAAIGNEKGALSDIDRALALKPGNIIALQNRGTYRLSTGNPRGALADFDRALSVNPNSILALVGRCNSYAGLGNHQTTEKECNIAIEKAGSQNSQALSGRATARFSAGNKKGALEDIDNAIQLDPKNSAFYINRGSFRYADGNKQGALSDFKTALKLGSTNINMYLGIGLIEEENGNLSEALTFYKKGLDIYIAQGNILGGASLVYRITQIEGKIR
jgi:tetratricopeptide (TPR) repeat protein/S1-C subfamily serine protease